MDVDDNDHCDRGIDRRATTTAAPSASPAADANDFKDEDAGETEEEEDNGNVVPHKCH